MDIVAAAEYNIFFGTAGRLQLYAMDIFGYCTFFGDSSENISCTKRANDVSLWKIEITSESAATIESKM